MSTGWSLYFTLHLAQPARTKMDCVWLFEIVGAFSAVVVLLVCALRFILNFASGNKTHHAHNSRALTQRSSFIEPIHIDTYSGVGTKNRWEHRNEKEAYHTQSNINIPALTQLGGHDHRLRVYPSSASSRVSSPYSQEDYRNQDHHNLNAQVRMPRISTPAFSARDRENERRSDPHNNYKGQRERETFEERQREQEKAASIRPTKVKKAPRIPHTPLPGGEINVEMPGKFGVSGTYKHYRETLVYRANWGDNRHNKVKKYTEEMCEDRLAIGECWTVQNEEEKQQVINEVVEEFPFLREVNYTDDWPVRVMSQRYIDARRKSIRRKAKGNDQGLRAEEIHRENRRSHSQHFQVKIEPGSPELRREVESEEDLDFDSDIVDDSGSNSTYIP